MVSQNPCPGLRADTHPNCGNTSLSLNHGDKNSLRSEVKIEGRLDLAAVLHGFRVKPVQYLSDRQLSKKQTLVNVRRLCPRGLDIPSCVSWCLFLIAHCLGLYFLWEGDYRSRRAHMGGRGVTGFWKLPRKSVPKDFGKQSPLCRQGGVSTHRTA